MKSVSHPLTQRWDDCPMCKTLEKGLSGLREISQAVGMAPKLSGFLMWLLMSVPKLQRWMLQRVVQTAVEMKNSIQSSSSFPGATLGKEEENLSGLGRKWAGGCRDWIGCWDCKRQQEESTDLNSLLQARNRNSSLYWNGVEMICSQVDFILQSAFPWMWRVLILDN